MMAERADSVNEQPTRVEDIRDALVRPERSCNHGRFALNPARVQNQVLRRRSLYVHTHQKRIG